jgi:uncharacterized phage protein (TIGR02218 family)
MRTVSASLQAKLDSGATTLCTCWRLARKDGTVMGFTDHDRDLTFNGVLFRASTGLSSSQAESGLGFAPAASEAAGVLQADSLTESDLVNGLYDGAAVESWLVDWSAVEDRVLLDVACIGEVTRGEFAFSAELRSSAHVFDQQQGCSYQRFCSADLGDARCGVDLSTAAFHASGAVMASEGGIVSGDLSRAFAPGFFAGGRINFSSGANAGASFTVKSHMQDGLRASIAFWSAPANPIAAGDAFSIVAGCDKSPSTCQTKFANIFNFRGFPHMPGNDRVIAYPSSLAPALDGGSFFR